MYTLWSRIVDLVDRAVNHQKFYRYFRKKLNIMNRKTKYFIFKVNFFPCHRFSISILKALRKNKILLKILPVHLSVAETLPRRGCWNEIRWTYTGYKFLSPPSTLSPACHLRRISPPVGSWIHVPASRNITCSTLDDEGLEARIWGIFVCKYLLKIFPRYS